MQTIISQGIAIDDLVNSIANRVLNSISSLPSVQQPEIIDRAELCKRLDITQPTAIRYEKKGTLPAIRIGNAIRYNWPEVIRSLENKKGGGK